jgi:hypothetical protein
MVSQCATSIVAAVFVAPALRAPLVWAAEEKSQSLLMRLDPPRRAMVLMALLAIVLVGVGLVALAILAGRRALRISRTSLGPTPRHDDSWYKKPLVPPEIESSERE